MSIRTIVENGFEGIIAEIECQTSRGLPSIIIVGFATKAVDEAKERIRGAFSCLPVEFLSGALPLTWRQLMCPRSTLALI